MVGILRTSTPLQALLFGCSRQMRFAEFVVVVVDVQHSLTSEPHRSRSVIVGWHPERTGLDVCLNYQAFLCPEGRIFRRLSLDSPDSEIGGVDPNCPAIQKLVVDLR